MSAAVVAPPLLPSELAPGLHEDIPPEVYHRRERGIFSQTVAGIIEQAPALYPHWLKGVDAPPTPALRIGNAFHCAALEPERFARQYAICPIEGPFNLRGPKDAREHWRQHYLGGRIELGREDGELVLGMARSLREHPVAGRLLAHRGIVEGTVRWTDPETGLPCKARPDWYSEALATVADLKSTDDASKTAFRRSIRSYGYYRQEPHYRDGLAAIGKPVDVWVFIAVEKTPPYLVGVWALEEADVSRGREEMRALMGVFEKCLKTDSWPGYSDGIERISLSRWTPEGR